MKKLLALLMAIAMLVSIVACGGSEEKENVIDTNNPILNATANLLDKFSKEGGTITLSAKGDALDMLEENYGISFESLMFATDTEQFQAILNGQIGDIKLSESIYYGNQNLVVNAPNLLGGAYGINLGTFEKDFNSSIFSPDSDSEFAIDEEVMTSINEAIAMIEQVMSGEATEMIPGLDTEAASAAISKIATELYEGIYEIYPPTVTEKDGYTTTTVTITDDKLSDVFDLLADLLEDEEVEALMEVIVDMMAEYTDAELPVDQLPALIRQLGTTMDQYASQMDVSCDVSVKTSKDGLDNEISMLLNMDVQGTKGSIGYTVTDKTTDTKEKFVHTVTLSFVLDGAFEDMIEGGFVSSKQDAVEGYSAVSEEGFGSAANVRDILFGLIESGMKIETEWNKKDGDFDVTVEFGDQELFTMESNLKITDSKMTYVFEKIAVAGMFDTSDYIDSITLEITAGKPKGLSAPNFKNVFKMSEGDIVDLVGFMEDLGIFGGSSSDTEQKVNVKG